MRLKGTDDEVAVLGHVAIAEVDDDVVIHDTERTDACRREIEGHR
jgi:hypothetical protein